MSAMTASSLKTAYTIIQNARQIIEDRAAEEKRIIDEARSKILEDFVTHEFATAVDSVKPSPVPLCRIPSMEQINGSQTINRRHIRNSSSHTTDGIIVVDTHVRPKDHRSPRHTEQVVTLASTSVRKIGTSLTF
ncbi:hypothetical protein LY76DRAFT_144275 [Colletotrichum caudatum]|nr:hypothetical protein LY76DRAFT_144275 [Colletotrichum caudatum]